MDAFICRIRSVTGWSRLGRFSWWSLIDDHPVGLVSRGERVRGPVHVENSFFVWTFNIGSSWKTCSQWSDLYQMLDV